MQPPTALILVQSPAFDHFIFTRCLNFARCLTNLLSGICRSPIPFATIMHLIAVEIPT